MRVPSAMLAPPAFSCPRSLRQLLREGRGIAALEYVLIASVVSIALLGVLARFSAAELSLFDLSATLISEVSFTPSTGSAGGTTSGPVQPVGGDRD